ncbi:MAG: hypothetical protein IKO23_09730 [Bacteroidales bacterium]|nr:hypothetical protein [Bacteroidales bacterium]
MENTETMQVTPEERELIEAIRNFNRAYPNGAKQLKWYAQSLFDDMISKE